MNIGRSQKDAACALCTLKPVGALCSSRPGSPCTACLLVNRQQQCSRTRFTWSTSRSLEDELFVAKLFSVRN